MRLRPLVGRGRGHGLARGLVDIEVTLRRPVDAIGPVQPGVEPLRRVRRRHLPGQHEAQLVVERARIGLGSEVAGLPAPVGPGPGQTVEHLHGTALAGQTLGGGQLRQGRLVGHPPAQPLGHALFGHRPQPGRDTGFTEIFLRQDIHGHLRPGRRHLDALELEHDRAVRVADLARRLPKRHGRIRRIPGPRETTLDAKWHVSPPRWRLGCSRHVRQERPERGNDPRGSALSPSPLSLERLS